MANSAINYTERDTALEDANAIGTVAPVEGGSQDGDVILQGLGFNDGVAAIVQGDWVALVIPPATAGIPAGRAIDQSPATADNVLGIGVAAEAIPVNSWGRYVFYGDVDNVNLDAGVVAGNGLQLAAVAGRAEAAGAATQRLVGVCLTTPVANRGRVRVRCGN